MNPTSKKIANVLGIIMAWILSIALILSLVVTPVALSALSLLNPEAIIESVVDAFTQTIVPDEEKASADFGITQLSAVNTPDEDEVSDAAGDIGGQLLEGILGDEVSPEVVAQILDSNVAKKFVKLYTEGIANAFTDGASGKEFDETVVKEFVNANIDEIADLAQKLMPELSQEDKEELKKAILSAANENAEEFFGALPKPEELKEQILQENPAIGVLFQIFARRKAIKAAIVGAIILLSGLIFLCRIPGLRGFRWLATDLFVASGFCLLQSAGLLLGNSGINALLSLEPALASTAGKLISSFATGVVIRTVIMLVSAVALLVAYILINKARAKNVPVPVQTEPEVTEETAEND